MFLRISLIRFVGWALLFCLGSTSLIAQGEPIPTNDAGTQSLLLQHTQSMLAQWADNLAKLDQQIQKATDEVNNLTDLKNYIGDAAQKNLPADILGPLSSIYKSSTSIYQNVNQLANTAVSVAQNPSSLLNLYTPEDGIMLFEDYGYQFDAQRYKRYQTAAAAGANADATNADTIQQMDQLNDQLTSLQQKLSAATTQAEIEKLNGLIAAVQAKIAILESRRRAAVDTQAIVHYQNLNDAQEKKEKAAEGLVEGLGGAQDKIAQTQHHMSAIPGR